jgi:predicted ATPase
MYGLWRIYAWGGQMERVAQIADELMQLAQNSGESSLLLEAHRAVGFNQLYRGHLTDARQNFEQAIALYDPDLHAAHGHTYGTNTKAYCMMFDGLASLIMGYPDIAVTAHREALTYTRTLREPWTLGFALHSSALFNNLLGNAQQSHRLAKELISHSSEGGPEHLPAMGEIHLGYASVVMGDKAEGSERICRGLESFRATGAAVGSSYFLGWYGWSLSEAGRPEEGISILDEALEVPSKTGERIYEAELHRFKGEVLLNFETPDQKGAETSFHKALEIARSQSAKLWELRAAASLAHLWQSHGKITDARDLLAPIYGWFTEGFDTADLKEAKALLDELG